MVFQFFNEMEKKKREILSVKNAEIKWMVFSDTYIDIFDPNSIPSETVTINIFPLAVSTWPCL